MACSFLGAENNTLFSLILADAACMASFLLSSASLLSLNSAHFGRCNLHVFSVSKVSMALSSRPSSRLFAPKCTGLYRLSRTSVLSQFIEETKMNGVFLIVLFLSYSSLFASSLGHIMTIFYCLYFFFVYKYQFFSDRAFIIQWQIPNKINRKLKPLHFCLLLEKV